MLIALSSPLINIQTRIGQRKVALFLTREGDNTMAKKGKQQRQYNKQLQQLRKIQRKAQQKGIKLDLTPTPQPRQKKNKKQVQEIRKIKQEAKKQVKEAKTDNQFKPTQKQLAKAIKAKQSRIKPVQLVKPKVVKPKTTRQVQPRQQEQTKPLPPTPEEYTPPTPEQNLPYHVNVDPSFYSEAVIFNYRQTLRLFPVKAEPLLTAWLDNLIQEHGVDDVATMLQEGAKNGNIVNFEIAYSLEKLEGYIAEMLNYLPEMTDWYKAEVMEQFEEWGNI